jgi:hypothetical protein
MTYPVAGLYDHIATLLDTLGEHPGAVASNLRSEDVRGVRGSALAHPLCRWLTRLVPDLGVVLGLDTVHVFRPGRGPTRQGVTVPMPPPVRGFVDRFDDGHYPELELCLGPPLAAAGYESPIRFLPQQVADTMPLPLVRTPRPAAVIYGEVIDLLDWIGR